MAGGSASLELLNQLGILASVGAAGDLSDADLLRHFLAGSEAESRAALAALVGRHGPMVLRACRQALGDPHDAQDAFQATFLILAKKARSIREADSIAGWLHGVALRVAARSKADAVRRRAHELRGAALRASEAERQENRPDPWPELHEEVARLPARYREPVVLCYLEGLSTEAAARRLGWPRGTVLSRLSRARERLRGRLTRRGLVFSAGLSGAWMPPGASTAAMPAVLINATVRACLGFAGRQAMAPTLVSATAAALARGVLHTMTISKLKSIGASALACVLALGGVQTFAFQVGGIGPGGAKPDGDDWAVLTRKAEDLRTELDKTYRVNAEVQRRLQDIRAQLETLLAVSRQATVDEAVTRIASSLKPPPSLAVDRLADALKRHPPRRSAGGGDRMQVFMLDLVAGGTTLIADEPVAGLTWSGAPRWSHDGKRIVFDTAPGKRWELSRLMAAEARDGRPTLTDLGPGNCSNFSPDDKTIAFLLNPGAVPGAQEGVWAMEADGSGRRRVAGFGAPLWSPDGREFLTNSFSNPTRTTVMNLEKGSGGHLEVPGYRIFSWPSWAGPGTLVSALSTREEGDTIALIDVSKPAEARIIEVLWTRGEDIDVTPRWPVYWPETRRCFFVGVEPDKRTLYSVDPREPRRAKRVEREGQDDNLGGLAFSPDGRYLLFGANRPDPRQSERSPTTQ